jgi:hypothetical protein
MRCPHSEAILGLIVEISDGYAGHAGRGFFAIIDCIICNDFTVSTKPSLAGNCRKLAGMSAAPLCLVRPDRPRASPFYLFQQ